MFKFSHNTLLISSTTDKDDVVVILSSSSSDEDCEKDNQGKVSALADVKQEKEEGEARTVDAALKKLIVKIEPCQEVNKPKLILVPKKQLQDQLNMDSKKPPALKRENSNQSSLETKKVLKREESNQSDSDSDEIISQEDLLAHLGLSSVKELNKKESAKGGDGSAGSLAKMERKPLFSHRPKESIVELLKVPKTFDLHKCKKNGDTDGGMVNGVENSDSRPESPPESSDEEDDGFKSKEQLISRLRNELRNEEAKLLLLKRLQAAQNDIKMSSSKFQKENIVSKTTAPGVPQHGVKLANQMTGKKSQSLPPPPPLKASSASAGTTYNPQRILPKACSQPTVQSSTYSKFTSGTSTNNSSENKPTSAIKNLQNVVSSMTNLIQPSPVYAHSSTQGSPIYTAPSQSSPVRPTPVRANSHPVSSGYVSFQQHLPQSSHHSSVTSSAGKQAAAKMALRKQLERTLLQIPPPKPPPPEWPFIPSLNSPEFMSLVGLEEVVCGLASKAGKSPLEEKVPPNPKVCSQCGSDFTPTWKKRLNGIIVCEKCTTVNVKKELKAEHTSRLKAAFLKALKQEQEIEQKMNDTAPIAPKPQVQRSSPQPLPTHHHLAHHQSVLHHHHQPVQPRLYHHHQPPPHSESLLFQLQQQHIQQQQQEIEAARRQADVRWHPYLTQHRHSAHKPQHHHSYVSESDRQYLLDMIPSLPAPTLGYGSSRL